MSKTQEIRDRVIAGKIDGDDFMYILDLVDVILAYNLTEMIPPNICDDCPHRIEGVSFGECEQTLDECSDPIERFFEGALEFWLEQQEKEGNGL
jgi:hypothetical protein